MKYVKFKKHGKVTDFALMRDDAGNLVIRFHHIRVKGNG